jgi:hypothetical protein
MKAFNVMVSDEEKFMTEKARFVYQSKTDSFFVFPTIRSMLCYTIPPSRYSPAIQKGEQIKAARKEFQIEVPNPDAAHPEHFCYNVKSRIVVFSDHKHIYAEKLYLKEKENSEKAVFQTIGEALGPRKIRRLKFHPLNGNIVGILYESNIFEIYDLESDLEEPLYYKNFTHLTKGISSMVEFCFVISSSPVVQSLDDLRVFLFTSEHDIYSVFPVFLPGLPISDSFFESASNIKDDLSKEDFVLAEQIERIKESLADINNNGSGQNQISLVTNYNDQLGAKPQFIESLTGTETHKKVLIFEILKISNLGNVLILVTADTSEMVTHIFLCVNELSDPEIGKKQVFIELQKLKIVNEAGCEVRTHFENRSLFIFKKTKLMKIDFSFLDAFSIKMNASSFRVEFSAKLAAGIQQIDHPDKFVFVDFRPVGTSLIYFLVKEEGKSTFQILLHDIDSYKKLEEAKQNDRESVENQRLRGPFDKLLFFVKNIKIREKAKMDLTEIENFTSALKEIQEEANSNFNSSLSSNDVKGFEKGKQLILEMDESIAKFKDLLNTAEGFLQAVSTDQAKKNAELGVLMNQLEEFQKGMTSEEERVTKEVEAAQTRQEKIQSKFSNIYNKLQAIGEGEESKPETILASQRLFTIEKAIEAEQIQFEVSVVG